MSQSRTLEDVKVELTYAQKRGTTKPLRDLVPRLQSSKDKKQLAKRDREIPRNFIGRRTHEIKSPHIQHQVDPVRQKHIFKSEGSLIEPLVNTDGLFAGGSPHDPTGDIGENYYIQSVNITQIGIYDKTGTLITSFTGNTLWNDIGFNSGGDPIILYDQEMKRWIMTEFPTGFGANSRNLLVAVSVSGDPLGSWDVYNFSTVRFPDYPKYGIWSNAYSVTTNEEGAGVLHSYFINREQLLQGDSLIAIQRVSLPGNNNTEARFFVATPVDWTGLTPPPADRDPIIVSLNDASWNVGQDEDQIEIFSIDLDWENPASTQINQHSVPVSPYDAYPCSVPGFGFSCVPQPGGSGLDAIPEVIMNQVHYRNFTTYESMVMNFVTDATAGENLSGIRWIEFRRNDSIDWFVHQEGTFAPDDGLHRYMGSICMDGQGNIALAYNVSSDSVYAGIRYTGRRFNDPLGVMTIDEFSVIEGSNTINAGSRFGDYAHMSVDPVNDRTFWHTSEYANGGTSYTRIVAYELTKDSLDLGPVVLQSPITAGDLNSSETVVVNVQNFGLDTIRSFQVGYVLDDSNPIMDTVDFVLTPDRIYSHVFEEKADLSQLGNYTFKIFTHLENDQLIQNDTIQVVVERLPRFDAALVGVGGVSELVCGESNRIQALINNLGVDTINSLDFMVTLNGDDKGITNWIGTIPPAESAEVDILLEGIQDGSNLVELIVQNPNLMMDQIPVNDTITAEFQALLNTVEVNLSLQFDEFPRETSWELSDEDGNVLYSGDNYDDQTPRSVIETSFCLDPDACYVFTIHDSFGDGISAYGVSGSYQLTDDEGNILASLLNANFGRSEENSFCATFDCNVRADIDLSPDNGNGDGAIMITVLGGVGPFQYSIDGGMTFQDSPLFTDLTTGIYQVFVSDINGCTYEKRLELSLCTGSLEFIVNHVTGENQNDGSIEVLITGIDSVISYSLDNGMTTQDSNIFSNLEVGAYDILVIDDKECEYSALVNVRLSTSTHEELIQDKFLIYPNPTESHFTVEISGIIYNDINLPVSIINEEGKLVQRSQLALYDNAYKGVISLYNYPSGKYYIRIEHPEISVLKKLVRL